MAHPGDQGSKGCHWPVGWDVGERSDVTRCLYKIDSVGNDAGRTLIAAFFASEG
jgi:hypothetical protein